MVESASALTVMIPAPCACMTSPLLSTHGAPGTITDSPRTAVHRASESTKEMMYPWIRVMLTGTQRPPCCIASFVVRIRLCGKALELSREVAFVAPVIGSHVHMLRIASTLRAVPYPLFAVTDGILRSPRYASPDSESIQVFKNSVFLHLRNSGGCELKAHNGGISTAISGRSFVWQVSLQRRNKAF